MPIYRFRVEGGRPDEEVLGFYQDNAALDYARRIARGQRVEIWRGSDLVACYDRAVPAPEPAEA